MGEAPPSRYDYEMLLDYDPSEIFSEHTATDQSMQYFFQNLLDDTVYYTSY